MHSIAIFEGLTLFVLVKVLFLMFYLLPMTSGKRKSGSRGSGRRNKRVDEKLFREAVKAAVKQPRLAFYSPVASCILNYWKSAVPRFSISEFLARVVEKELAKAWPQLYKKSVKELEKKLGTRKKKRRSSTMG